MTSFSITEQYVQAMVRNFQGHKAGGARLTFQLQLTGEGGGVWTIAIADGRSQARQGAPGKADMSITMSVDNYLKLAAGGLNVVDAYRKGQIQVGGNTDYALRFTEFFPPWAGLVTPAPPPTPVPPPPPTPAPTPSPVTPPVTPSPPPPVPAPAGPTLADYVRAMPAGFRADRVGGLQTTYQFQLGDGGGVWTVSIANRTCTVAAGQTIPPAVVIGMSGANFIKLAQGNLNTTQAYQQGQVRINGDLNMAARITDFFGPWAGAVGTPVTPTPTPPTPTPPTPTPTPTPPTPQPTPTPTGPVNPTLLNGSFDDYQTYIRDGVVQTWKENQFPERYGAHWTFSRISEGKGKFHLMDSEVFGKFTQKYFGGGGRDYHIEGDHSQVITSRYDFDVLFLQTVAAQPGRTYTFSGSIVSFYKGTSGERADGKIFKTIGIDPTGGRDYKSPNVIWGERDGKDNEWRYPSVRATAQASAITVFIRLENTEEDVGKTELNIIHLDGFSLK